MEILGKIFGSPARVKIMRLFLLNKTMTLANREIVRKSRINAETVRRECNLLNSIGFIRKKGKNWVSNLDFKYLSEVENLLIGTDTLDRDSIEASFRKAGKIKLLLVSGIFIKNKESRVDLLIVGDALKKARIEEIIRKLEAEIGTELTYALFNTKDFTYRLNMYDKLVRDILDFPHQIIIQNKELSTQALKKA